MENYNKGINGCLDMPSQVEYNRRKNVEQDNRISVINTTLQELLNTNPDGFLPKVYYGLTRGSQTYRFIANTVINIEGLDAVEGDAIQLSNNYEIDEYIPAIAIYLGEDQIKILIQGDYNVLPGEISLTNMRTGYTIQETLATAPSLQLSSYLGDYNAQDNINKQLTVLHDRETNKDNVVFASVDFNGDGTYNWVSIGGFTNGADGKSIRAINNQNKDSVIASSELGDYVLACEHIAFSTEVSSWLVKGDVSRITSLNPVSFQFIGNIEGPKGDKGDVGAKFKGTYSSSNTYEVGDIVTYKIADYSRPELHSYGTTSSFVRVECYGDIETPLVSSGGINYRLGHGWNYVAEGGLKGFAGANGQNGRDGEDGQSFQMQSGLYSIPENYGQSGNVGPNGETLLQLPTLPQTGITGKGYVCYDPLTTPLNPFYDMFYANDNDTEWTIIHPFSGIKGQDGAVGPQGPQGPQGIQGPQGPSGEDGISFNYMGSWTEGNEHYSNDVVTYNGSTYICINDILESITPPDVDTVHWDLMASKGATGEQGSTGATPNIAVTATTLEPTQQATATVSGTAENPIITFGIPKGEMGNIYSMWAGTQAEYDAIETKDINTFYFIKEE